MEIFYYITMGWIALFLIAYIWWGRSLSYKADIVFLALFAIGACYAFFLVGYGLAKGEVISSILLVTMMAIVAFMSFWFGKYNSRRRQQLINSD